MTRTVTKGALIAAGIIALLVTGALALPVSLWRTGEVSLPELVYSPSSRGAAQLARIWIDADAACGTGQHRDPDDCLALLSLATASNINIVGISTVFGNAPVSETDPVMRALVQVSTVDPPRRNSAPLPVFKGCGAVAPRCLDGGGSPAVHAALLHSPAHA